MTYTPEQVGAAATPLAHAANAPAPNDDARDETPDAQSDPTIPRAGNRWRAGVTLAPAPGPGTDSDPAAFVSDHSGVGTADQRRVYDSGSQGQAGYPLPKAEGFYPSPEQLINEQLPEVISPNAAPARNRAGSTGEDPTRTSRLPLWLFSRPFDKWASERLGSAGVEKFEQASPLASVPVQDTGDVANAYPSAGGRWAAGRMNPVGIIPNSFRLIPRPWDELLVTPQTETVQTTDAPPRGRRWRTGV
jgi:hypothetical protein